MAKSHYLRFLIRNRADDLIVEVRKQTADRLRLRLDSDDSQAVRDGFFWFDTVDGRSIAINFEDVQGVRLLWDVAAHPSDNVRYEGRTSIYLRGRAAPIEDSTENL